MNTIYLESITRLFEYYKSLGEKTFNQLEEKDLFWKYNEESNSIATIVQHLSGNMLSRWTNFLTEDGEKDWRNRDAEFENIIHDKVTLLKAWEEGWNCLFNAIKSINDRNLHTTIYIRNQGHTVIDVFNRQLAHYPYHIGQIVFIAKMIKDNEWISLSIPKGNSNQYNVDKFSKPKRDEHFTDEYLKKDE